MRADWKVSATIALAAYLGAIIWLPYIAADNRVLTPMASAAQAMAWLPIVFFGVVACVRFANQYRNAVRAALREAGDRVRGRLVPSWDSVARGLWTRPLARAQMASTAAARPPSADARTDSALPAESGPIEADPHSRWRRPVEHSHRNRDAIAQANAEPVQWSVELLDRVEWKRFEDLCCEYYRARGLSALTTPLGADGGVDIRLLGSAEEAGPVTTAIVQCKAHSRQVGVGPVRELRGVMADEKVEKGFFMAPRGFTDEAKSFASRNHITLVDGLLFLAMLRRLPDQAQRNLLGFALAGDWTTPTCPQCGVKMKLRSRGRRRFWGCSSFPRCRAILRARA
jgi:restriction system protein